MEKTSNENYSSEEDKTLINLPVYIVSVETDLGALIKAVYSNEEFAWNHVELEYHGLLWFLGDDIQKIKSVQIAKNGVIVILDTGFNIFRIDEAYLNPYDYLYSTLRKV